MTDVIFLEELDISEREQVLESAGVDSNYDSTAYC